MQRGIANIALMIGIVVSTAVVLVLGIGVTFKIIDERATGSPEFLAADLALLIDTVQASPEPITYMYLTPSIDDWPAIGSLEIDDDAGQLCVSPLSEQEIYNNVVSSASGAAGFGAAATAYLNARRLMKKRALIKNMNYKFYLRENKLLSQWWNTNHLMSTDKSDGIVFRNWLLETGPNAELTFSKNWEVERFNSFVFENFEIVNDIWESPENLRTLMDNVGMDETWCRNQGYSSRADAEIKLKYYLQDISTGSKGDALRKSNTLRKTMAYASYGETGELRSLAQTKARFWGTGPEIRTPVGDYLVGMSQINKIKFNTKVKFSTRAKTWFWEKIPFTQERKAMKVKVANIQETAKARAVIKANTKWGVWKSRLSAGAVYGTTALVVLYSISQGDYQQAILAVVLPVTLNYVSGYVMKYVANKLAARLTQESAKLLVAHAIGNIKYELFANPEPVISKGAAITIWVVEIALNTVDVVMTIVTFDLELLATREAANSQIQVELKRKVCKSFSTAKPPLLYPANCIPKITYNDPEDTDPKSEARSTSDVARRIGAPPVNPYKETSDKLLRMQAPKLEWSLESIGNVLGAILNALEALTQMLIRGIGDFINGSIDVLSKIQPALHELFKSNIPTPTCEQPCDQEFARQDCPNYYIAKSYDFWEEFGVFAIGWTGATVVWAEWGYDVYAIIQMILMFDLTINHPEKISTTMWHMYDLGLTKKVNSQTVGQTVFANNEGYWYAEFPAALELTKTYNQTSGLLQKSQFIIAKAA